MATINPYINFDGNAEEAFTFYKSVFGGEFEQKAVKRPKGYLLAFQEDEPIAIHPRITNRRLLRIIY